MQPPDECPDCGNAHSDPGIVATLCDHPCHYPPPELLQQVGATGRPHRMAPNPDTAVSLTTALWLIAATVALVVLLLATVH